MKNNNISTDEIISNEKYNIEGNIDFFSELYKSLDEEEEEHKTEEDSKLCLITNKPLIDKFVELKCGHKFNYVPLYKDIYNHKIKFNSMEASNGSLKGNEIRCPYCRQKQVGLLPYYEHMGVKKIGGVNFLSETEAVCFINSYYYGKCDYTKCNPCYNEALVEHKISNNKLIKCHYNHVSKLEHNNKSYCYTHKKEMNKIFVKEIKQQEKQKIKDDKQKVKEDEKINKQKVKEDEKLMKKSKKIEQLMAKQGAQGFTGATGTQGFIGQLFIEEENIKMPSKDIQLNTTNNLDENVIISKTKLICVEILKTGLNKGNQCSQPIYNEEMCKRHYNIKNKII
jgi:hypothetical protein